MSASDLRPRAFQFGVRTLFVVLFLCAILLAWWRDRTQLTVELEQSRAMLDAFRHAKELAAGEPVAGDTPAARSLEPLPNKCGTPEEFIKALREITNWYEFADKTADPFAKTPIADKAVPALIELLRDPDAEVRTRAVCTLGKIGRQAESVVPALIPVLEDKHRNVRWHAALALGQFRNDAKAAIPALRQQMNDDDSPIAAFAGAMLLRIDTETADVEPRLIELLRHADRENRQRAIEALQPIGSGRVKQAFVGAFRLETDRETRDRLARAIAWLDAKSTAKTKTPSQ